MKKKLLLICAIIAMAYPGTLVAQYTYLTNTVLNTGNPGGVNTDSDASTTGWTELIAPSLSANSWSTSYTLPFAFDFYGVAVTDAILSGNGVLSFTTTATALPADANTALPATGTANIPDNSILGFWDSYTAATPTGSNDRAYYKVFGTAPNRQVWFRYHSYEYGDNGSGGAQSSFTYWAMALEETTNKVYVIDMNYGSGHTGLTSTIGVQKNSTTAVEIGAGLEAMGTGGSSNSDNTYHEFTPVLLVNDNAAIASIDAPTSPLVTGVQNVDVTLENAGLNTLSSATINWSVNGVAQTAFAWTGSLAQNGTASVNLGTYNFLTGNSTILVWSTIPNGMTDGDTSNDSLAVTLCTSLTGTYTIGGVTPDYLDVASAAADLNSCGVSGPVTFNIAAGTYTGAVMIGDVVGSSSSNTITFNGAGAATTTLSYDGAGTENATFTLDGTDYVTLKNVTVENTESSSNGWGVHMTNTADNNMVDSCIINLDITTTSSSFIGVLISGSLTSTSTNGNNGNFNTVSNTTMNGGYYGTRFWGNSSATPDNTGNKVENCTVNDAYAYGFYFYYQDSPEANGNTVPSLRATFGYGIYMNYAKHPTVTKNSLHGARSYGLYLSQVNTTAQGPTARAIVINNMISSLGFGEGIYLTAADSVDIWHNTVYSENENALWINSSSDGYNVRNNIFVSLNGPEVVELDAIPDATMDLIDYNLYYHSAAGVIADITGTDEATLAAWQLSYPALNANSVTGDPVFYGATNLHASSSVPNDVAVVISGISDDIDGDLRSGTTPDMGADEFTPPTCFLSSALNVTNLTFNGADLGWTAGGTETNWDVEWGPAGFTPGTGTLIANTASNPVSISGLTAVTGYDFYVRGICTPGDTAAWAGPSSFMTPCGPYTPTYSEDFTTYIPQCWEEFQGVLGATGTTVTNATTSNWASDGFGNVGFTGAAKINLYSTGRDEWLMSPSIDLGTGTAYQVSFDVALTDYANTSSTTFGVDDTLACVISTDNGVTWSQANILQMWGAGTEPSNTGDYVAIDLTAYSGMVKFGFYAASSVGNADNDVFIDNFLVDLLPNCPQPAGIATSNLTATSIDISWTVGAANSNVEYGVAGFTQGTGTVIAATGGMASITGLMADTDYEFYVQDSCGAASLSAWSGPGSFYTGYCTPAPVSGDGQGITNFTMGTINNTTVQEPGHYGNYDTLSTNVIQGSPQQDFSIELSTGYSYGTKIWVDWNNDLVFDAVTEEVFFVLTGNANPTLITGSIAIPATAAIGSYKLRIGGTDNDAGPADACYSGSWAAFEDYTINVIAACHVAATDVVAACDTYTWIDGMVYTASNNTAVDTAVSTFAGACDTVFTLDLTINSSSVGTDVQTACDTYTWIDGMTYTASNTTAMHTLTNSNGCDSVVTLDLTINNSATSTDIQVACDSYTWMNGLTYTANNNTATHVITGGATNGCDSTITLDLTINSSNTGIAAVAACDSYTWIDGVTYMASTNAPTHTLTNAAGCDSVVTLYLTINTMSFGTASITACDSYTWIDGMTYTASNNSATYVLNNSFGCDSIVTLNLILNMAVTNTITATECESYTSAAGNTYMSTGMYTETFTAANGCDSVLTLDLTITNADYTVSVSSGIHLTSNQPGATYQWLDCTNGNAPIAGATNQVYIATVNGEYACEVTYQTCSGTSACVTVNTVGIDDASATFASVYPNPANDILTITLSDLDNAQFELIDMQGKVVISTTTITSGQKVDVSNLESGVYFVRLVSDENSMIKRVVKN